MMKFRYAVILAAGQGTRMKSKHTKSCILYVENQWSNMLWIRLVNYK